jgi:hypothetical protein
MKEMTKEEAQSFIRKVMGPTRRRVEGQEHDNLMLMFAMMEPVRESNNQHSWCAEYIIGDKQYDVHYFPNEEPFIDEVGK